MAKQKRKRDWSTHPESPYRQDQFNEHDLKQIETMSGLGLPNSMIAPILGFSLATFERRLAENPKALLCKDKGKGVALANVAKTAYSMAVSGDDSRMTIFYLKTQAGWKETIDHEVKIDYQKLTDDELREVIKLTSEQYVALETAKEEDENEP